MIISRNHSLNIIFYHKIFSLMSNLVTNLSTKLKILLDIFIDRYQIEYPNSLNRSETSYTCESESNQINRYISLIISVNFETK